METVRFHFSFVFIGNVIACCRIRKYRNNFVVHKLCRFLSKKKLKYLQHFYKLSFFVFQTCRLTLNITVIQ
jgi:hypothetical protein